MGGGSLHNRLIGKPFAVQRSTTALQIGEGLAFLHACRVIHRDLKSQNVLLDGTDNAKLADYGLDLEPAQQGISSHRNMAPEIFNSQPTTEKVDIWSAGCILIELFGGVTAYHDCHNFLQISARMSERRAPEIPSAVPVPVGLLFDDVTSWMSPQGYIPRTCCANWASVQQCCEYILWMLVDSSQDSQTA